MKRRRGFVLLGGASAILVAGALVVLWSPLRAFVHTLPRSRQVLAFLSDPAAHDDWRVEALTRCGQAPFLLPSSGFIGYLWGDSFQFGHLHQGIDIFSGTAPGVTPVYAAYDGYLTREAHWKASVIIRHPHDPLHPNRQIWTYYTHMADADGHAFIRFPPGTHEVFVTAGTLLGYQGNYSGNPLRPVGVHLHFSIVRDDGQGHYRNELDIANTLDPSPYLGMVLDAWRAPISPPHCP